MAKQRKTKTNDEAVPVDPTTYESLGLPDPKQERDRNTAILALGNDFYLLLGSHADPQWHKFVMGDR